MRLLSDLRPIYFALIALILSAGTAVHGQELPPEWTAHLPVGAALSAGIKGLAVDAEGVSYVTGISGPSGNTDVTTAAFASDGSLLWSSTFNGTEDWHDQGRGIALGPDGAVYVTGNTPGFGSVADVLILKYDAVTGDQLDFIQFASEPNNSESGVSVAADSAGGIYVGGNTTGDGGDAMAFKLHPDGTMAWIQKWDGPASGPFSQDSLQQLLLGPDGNPVVLVNGIMGSNHPDYVVIKYSAADGTLLWETAWGVTGEDSPLEMEIDAAGDVYVTGTGIDLIDKYSTIKLAGSDGSLLWQAYDSLGIDDSPTGLALDGEGGVYITGAIDVDGDESNFNDNFYTVKRDAVTGAMLWRHTYGSTCHGCFDVPTDVIVDPAGHALVAGGTSSPPYAGDVILLVLDAATGLETDRGLIPWGTPESAGTGILAFDGAYNLYDGGQRKDSMTGQVEMTVAKWTSLVGAGNEIPCEDVLKFRVRCIDPTGAGNKLQFRVVLTDTTHDGEQVTVEVDGEPYVLTIFGNKAQTSINGALPGPHTVELTEPAGCFPVEEPTCPGD